MVYFLGIMLLYSIITNWLFYPNYPILWWFSMILPAILVLILCIIDDIKSGRMKKKELLLLPFALLSLMAGTL